MAESRLDIVIGQRSEGNALSVAQAQIQKLQADAAGLGQEMRTALAFAGVGAGVLSIQQLGQQLESFIRTGVGFNQTLEDAKLGIAATIKQFDPEKFATFDAALIESGEALDLLVEKAQKSPATVQQLVSAFQGVSGAASSAGIPIKKQVDLIVLMSQALSGLGIRSEQILQESRALLTGNINEDAMAARILGITREQIMAAKEQGQVYEFLTGKLGAFSEAGERGMTNLTTLLSNLSDAWDKVAGQVSEPIFDAVKAEVTDLISALQDPDFASNLEPLMAQAAELVRTLGSLTQFAMENANALAMLARIVFTVTAAFAAMKIAAASMRLGASLMASISQWHAETVAIQANTQAKLANATAGRTAGAARGIGMAGAVGLGVGIGFAAYQAGISWAADKNEESRQTERLSKSGHQAALAMITLGRSVDSTSEKMHFLKTAEAQLAELKDQLEGATEDQATALNTFIGVIEKERARIVALKSDYLALGDAREKAAAVKSQNDKLWTVGKAADDQIGKSQADRDLAAKPLFEQKGILSKELERVDAEVALDRFRMVVGREVNGKNFEANLARRIQLTEQLAAVEKNLSAEDDGKAKATRETEARLAVYRLESDILAARKAGNEDEAASLEDRLKTIQAIKELESAGVAPDVAAAEASRRVALERSSSSATGVPRVQETDRLQQMGLFFGSTAQQLNMARQHLDVLQKIEANTRNSGSGSPQPIVR